MGWTSLLTIILVASFALFIGNKAAPFNPTKTPSLVNRGISPLRILMPQGFAFFTRNPREADIYLYQREAGDWRTALMSPHARSSNLFGLKRKSRAQLTEYALLLSRARADLWTSCDENPSDCLPHAEVVDTVQNITPNPTICGIAGFVRQEPVPWAWSESKDDIDMPSELIKLHVSC